MEQCLLCPVILFSEWKCLMLFSCPTSIINIGMLEKITRLLSLLIKRHPPYLGVETTACHLDQVEITVQNWIILDFEFDAMLCWGFGVSSLGKGVSMF